MLPAILDMLIALAGLAIGLFVSKLWMSGARKKPPAHGISRLCLWRTYPRAVCIGLIVLFVVGVMWKGLFQIREATTAASIRAQLATQAAKAEALAKKIPKGCPKDVDAEHWNAKVETWRIETARIPGLDQAFATDKGDYPHDCPIEWVRNRLDYFAGKLDLRLAR